MRSSLYLRILPDWNFIAMSCGFSLYSYFTALTVGARKE
jgi:hypothetical protein